MPSTLAKWVAFIWDLELESTVTYLGIVYSVIKLILAYFLTICFEKSYDFSGYGGSSGKPSEKNLYADINAAWHSMRNKFGISPDKIILYGQSIGTVPTVDLASRYDVGAVILHSPLMSGMRVAFPNTKRTWFFDAFPR